MEKKKIFKELKKFIDVGIKKSRKKNDYVNLYFYTEIKKLIEELEKN